MTVNNLFKSGFEYKPKEFFSELSNTEDFTKSWTDLPVDEYIQGGYNFRKRRFSRCEFSPSDSNLSLLPLEGAEYLQGENLNSYAGGIERIFSPVKTETLNDPTMRYLLHRCFNLFDVPNFLLVKKWLVDIHQFRITTNSENAGTPTPEGIHRDGFPFGSIILVERNNIKGGVNFIYSNEKQFEYEKEMKEPFESMHIIDTRVMHSVSPIEVDLEGNGYRDVLIFGFHCPETFYAKEE